MYRVSFKRKDDAFAEKTISLQLSFRLFILLGFLLSSHKTALILNIRKTIIL